MSICAGYRPGGVRMWSALLTGVMAGRRISFAEGICVLIYLDILIDKEILKPYSVLYLYTDNTIVERTLARRAAKSDCIAFWAIPIFERCYKHGIIIKPRRITSINNKISDFGSRLVVPGISSPSIQQLNTRCEQLWEQCGPDTWPHKKLIESGTIAPAQCVCPVIDKIDVSEKYCSLCFSSKIMYRDCNCVLFPPVQTKSEGQDVASRLSFV